MNEIATASTPPAMIAPQSTDDGVGVPMVSAEVGPFTTESDAMVATALLPPEQVF